MRRDEIECRSKSSLMEWPMRNPNRGERRVCDVHLPTEASNTVQPPRCASDGVTVLYCKILLNR